MSEHAAESLNFSDYIEKFDLWKDLTAVQRDELIAHTRYSHYAKREFIHRGALAHTGTLHVISGSLRVYLVSEEGREFTLYILRDGDIALMASISFLNTVPCDIAIEAGKNTELFISDTMAVRSIFSENINVRARAYEYAIERLSEMLWKFQQMIFLSADRRLARFLLAESTRTAGDEIRLTHEETAQYLGTAREVVSRLIREFSQEGLVQTFRGRIHILNRTALKERADA
ncbi:Crp/Fnr family transcriptional regulator [uncultured Selenomonas sp.]|jgi:probable transcriptional regulator|uniref:Crp/Fnr family transcriptional regulator n=1 Tax=uncultured Selenomonas sp. TaxID=159275 RepID=UPI0028DC9785|nr:Crp/Fnr family transcriptional regulator [uncultured Selenomonas sp.]